MSSVGCQQRGVGVDVSGQLPGLGDVGAAEGIDVDGTGPGYARDEIVVGRPPAVEEEVVLHERAAVDRVVDRATQSAPTRTADGPC